MERIAMTCQMGLEAPTTDLEKSLVEELQKLGLTLNEARILIYLVTHGHSAANQVSRSTGIQRTETYNYLSALLSKGIIFSTLDRPQKFYSMSIEEVIDHLVKTKQNALEEFQRKTSQYVQMFESLASSRVIRRDDKERYNVVLGHSAIDAKVGRMLSAAKKEVKLFLSEEDLFHFYHSGLVDQIRGFATKGIDTEVKASCDRPERYLKEKDNLLACVSVEKSVPASFLLLDGNEMIVIMEGEVKKSEACGFYANSRSMVSVFSYLYENLS